MLLTLADIELIAHSSSARFRALILAAMFTGCRQDELVNASWKQFNAKTGTLEVIGKGNKRRTIQLSAQATAHLGHTSVSITERVYLAFLTPEEAQAAKDKAA